LEFPKILESSPSNVVGTAQIRLNRRTGGQLMLRGRVILGWSSGTDVSQTLEDQPHLNWTLQLPGIFNHTNKIIDFTITYFKSSQIK